MRPARPGACLARWPACPVQRNRRPPLARPRVLRIKPARTSALPIARTISRQTRFFWVSANVSFPERFPDPTRHTFDRPLSVPPEMLQVRRIVSDERLKVSTLCPASRAGTLPDTIAADTIRPSVNHATNLHSTFAMGLNLAGPNHAAMPQQAHRIDAQRTIARKPYIPRQYGSETRRSVAGDWLLSALRSAA